MNRAHQAASEAAACSRPMRARIPARRDGRPDGGIEDPAADDWCDRDHSGCREPATEEPSYSVGFTSPRCNVTAAHGGADYRGAVRHQ
jgi:hypothetical protein